MYYAIMASGARVHGNGSAPLLCSDGRWQPPKFLFFFLLNNFKRKKKSEKERKERDSKPVFPLYWLA
jgi:hypothetical protein